MRQGRLRHSLLVDPWSCCLLERVSTGTHAGGCLFHTPWPDEV